MIGDFYQLALAALKHHLDVAQVPYQVDEGELIVAGHRLGIAISFEDFVEQGQQVIAPLDVQLHFDGDNGDRFRVGTLGVGGDRGEAMQSGVNEWHLLAASPLLAALGASVEPRRRPKHPPRLAGWDLFPGRMGVRGPLPPALDPGGAFYRQLLGELQKLVSRWEVPQRFELRSIYLMAARGAGVCEVQAAVNGLVDEKLTEALTALPWPESTEAYLYKQLFVLRHGE